MHIQRTDDFTRLRIFDREPGEATFVKFGHQDWANRIGAFHHFYHTLWRHLVTDNLITKGQCTFDDANFVRCHPIIRLQSLFIKQVDKIFFLIDTAVDRDTTSTMDNPTDAI